MDDTGDSPLDDSPTHLLHRATQYADDIFRVCVGIKIDGLTPRQLAILRAAAESEGASQTALGVRTGIDRSTLADIVRRLLKKGLLQRRRTREDARAYALRLTDEGRRVLRMAEPLARKVDERVLGPLKSEQRAQFIGAVRTIVTIRRPRS